MRLNLALVVSVIISVGIVSTVFTLYQISNERDKLTNELELKTGRIAAEFIDDDLPKLEKKRSKESRFLSDSIAKKHHLLGLVVYYNTDSILICDSSVKSLIPKSIDYVSQSITANSPIGNTISIGDTTVYQYIHPVTSGETTYAVIFYSDATYIDNIIGSIWFRNFLRWFFQAVAVSVVTVIIIRWGIYRPLQAIVEWVKAARSGAVDTHSKPPAGFLAPLHKEIVGITAAMQEAKAIAAEEAKLRTSSEAIWTAERLKAEMKQLLQGRSLIVISNREPYMHVHSGKGIQCVVPASGLITAMEPILNACGGLWVASGTGDADKETVDEHDKLQVPPEHPNYTLKRIWLTEPEERHFYSGFSNEGLYPLCLIAHTRPVFREIDWKYYRLVNERFAKAVLAEVSDEEAPLILIQDYHFALLPELIKKAKPKAKVAIFWHIPWPNPESFGICPWQKEILQGMLGADLIGFHTQYHCNHFLETVNKTLESRVSWDDFSVRRGEQISYTRPFPISIDFSIKDTQKAVSQANPSELLEPYGVSAGILGIGVDRIDYAKGLPEKFLALERFLEKHPEFQNRFTFVQIGAPSRSNLKAYADIVVRIEREAERINNRFATNRWKPILLLMKHHSHEEILPFYRTSQFCMVTSLHDGMNLVAKEYVAARHENDGVLILSQFTGAAHELQGALAVNPYDIEKMADAIYSALTLPPQDQTTRMKSMRQAVMTHNIYYWASQLLRTMVA
ncbi:MAG TPA: trehalose-6-phosphate synthase [Candidatus Kapabacteria bacterium]|nr:trehalose-6-phosphate synthase [Candidatus Kapabacteria bacterium]